MPKQSILKKILLALLLLSFFTAAAQADVNGWVRLEPYQVRTGHHSFALWYRMYIGVKADDADSASLKSYFIGAQIDNGGAAYTKEGGWVPYSSGLPATLYTGYDNMKEWHIGNYDSRYCPIDANMIRIGVGYGAVSESDLSSMDNIQSKSNGKFSTEHLISAFSDKDLRQNDKKKTVLTLICVDGRVVSGW